MFGQSFEWWPGFWQVWHNEAPKGMCGSYGCCAGGTQGPLYSAILTARNAARTRTGELLVPFHHVPEAQASMYSTTVVFFKKMEGLQRAENPTEEYPKVSSEKR